MKKENRRYIQRRVVVRRSPLHGGGVFALRALKAGERIYKNETIEWTAAIGRYEYTGTAGHTYFFGLSAGRVIDGGRRGNSARWLNHSCNANCEALEIEDRVFILALTAIAPGDEFFLDCRLVVDDTTDEEVSLSYVCRCGSSGYRGTVLAVGL